MALNQFSIFFTLSKYNTAAFSKELLKVPHVRIINCGLKSIKNIGPEFGMLFLSIYVRKNTFEIHTQNTYFKLL